MTELEERIEELEERIRKLEELLERPVVLSARDEPLEPELENITAGEALFRARSSGRL